MKYLTPRGKTVLTVIGIIAILALCRYTPKQTPPLQPKSNTSSTTRVEPRLTRESTQTRVSVPHCQTTQYTTQYRALIKEWYRGASQPELIDRMNKIETPTNCGTIQQRLIDRLELAARQGVIAMTLKEVKMALQEMKAVLSGIELIERDYN